MTGAERRFTFFLFLFFLQPSWDCQAIYEESRGKNAVGGGGEAV